MPTRSRAFLIKNRSSSESSTTRILKFPSDCTCKISRTLRTGQASVNIPDKRKLKGEREQWGDGTIDWTSPDPLPFGDGRGKRRSHDLFNRSFDFSVT